MDSRPVIFVIILYLVFTLVHSFVAISNEDLFSKIRLEHLFCEMIGPEKETCCWFEVDDRGTTKFSDDRWLGTYCQTCTGKGTEVELCEEPQKCPCTTGPEPPQPTGPIEPLQDGVLEQPPTPPAGPFVPPQGGVLQQPPPGEGGGPQPLTRGQGVLPQDGGLQQQPPADQGAAELPPASEGTQPATVEEEPVLPCPEGQVLDEQTGLCVLEDCPEGQVLDEGSGICVPEEPEAAEEEAAQSQPEEEQPSEESDSGDGGNN
jgi:hypothetical protein